MRLEETNWHYLGRNVGNGCLSNTSHAVNSRVTRSRGPGLLVYRARRGEYVLVGLKRIKSACSPGRERLGSNRNEKTTSKQPVPRILRIVGIISVQKHGPLITSRLDLPAD